MFHHNDIPHQWAEEHKQNSWFLRLMVSLEGFIAKPSYEPH
jgi:hypothetical protein